MSPRPRAVAGGFTPFIATALAANGSYVPVAWYMVGACLVSLLTGVFYQHRPVRDGSARVETVTI